MLAAMPRTSPVGLLALVASSSLAVACQSAPAEPMPEPRPSAVPARTAPLVSARPTPRPTAAPPRRPVEAKPVKELPPSPDDPLKGVWSLADATKGLPKEGKLTAVLTTDKGALECELFEDKAPITVAAFAGIARGLRPFKGADGKWAKRPGYDGTTFHRVVRGFMIQGGDPAGTGAGPSPGFLLPDEIWAGAAHEKKGQLCMANRGPDTNGMQFFVTDGAAPHLDGGYTIFGQCEAGPALEALATVPVRGERPVTPPKIEKVVVRRAPPKK